MVEIFWASSLNCVSLYGESVPRHWREEVEGAAGRRGQGCPVLDTAGSSQLQRHQHRAQLSPAATVVAALLRVGRKGSGGKESLEKVLNFPQVSFGKGSPSSYPNPKLLNFAFSCCPVEGESERVARGLLAFSQGQPATLRMGFFITL